MKGNPGIIMAAWISILAAIIFKNISIHYLISFVVLQISIFILMATEVAELESGEYFTQVRALRIIVFVLLLIFFSLFIFNTVKGNL